MAVRIVDTRKRKPSKTVAVLVTCAVISLVFIIPWAVGAIRGIMKTPFGNTKNVSLTSYSLPPPLDPGKNNCFRFKSGELSPTQLRKEIDQAKTPTDSRIDPAQPGTLLHIVKSTLDRGDGYLDPTSLYIYILGRDAFVVGTRANQWVRYEKLTVADLLAILQGTSNPFATISGRLRGTTGVVLFTTEITPNFDVPAVLAQILGPSITKLLGTCK